jgi:SAM-dependent methyltransferase
VSTQPTAAERALTLHLTGERTVPGVAEENYWYRRHEAAYRGLLSYCTGTVLEAGCGEGYGAGLIAEHGARVVALDYDAAAATHVARCYPRVHAVRGNLAFLPLRERAVDTIANLQVIEHLWDQVGFLTECRRVLRPGGRLVVTTPNRLTFTPDSDTPLNPFHTRELAPAELHELLTGAGFRVELLHGLHHGPALTELDRRYGGSIIEAQLAVVLGSLPGEARWPSPLLDDIAAITAEDFVLHGDDLDRSLDLVAVAVPLPAAQARS